MLAIACLYVLKPSAALSDGDGTSTAVTVATEPVKPVATLWTARAAFLKRNVPSIISLLSVVLNVVIISALIPNLRNDVTFMQGQAASIQSQVNSFSQTLVDLSGKIVGADAVINSFYGRLDSISSTFNATESSIRAFRSETEADLQIMKTTATEVLASFDTTATKFDRQLNATLMVAELQAAALQSQMNQAEADVTSLLQTLQVQSAQSLADIESASDTALSTATVSLQQLRAANVSALAQLQSLRDDFVDRVVPEVTADLQSLNQSIAIAQLTDSLENISGTTKDLSLQLAPARLYAIGPTGPQPANGRVMMPFPTVVFNSSGMASLTEPTLFTCQRAGFYRIHAQATMTGTNAYTHWTLL